MLSVKNLTFKIIPVVVLSAVLLFADIFINRPGEDVSASNLVPVLPQQADKAAVGSKADTIIGLYEAFDVAAATEVTQVDAGAAEVGLTPAQQQQQQGLLRELYINDELYRLSAIVNQSGYTASLSVTNVKQKDAPSERLQLKAGDTLQHYKVTAVTARRITLQHEERELWLQLFTPEQILSAANSTETQ